MPLPACSVVLYHGVMTFWQADATRHGHENPCVLSITAMVRKDDSQPRTGKVAM
jgi:hypothetical protein